MRRKIAIFSAERAVPVTRECTVLAGVFVDIIGFVS
jgi:hypothetical protein